MHTQVAYFRFQLFCLIYVGLKESGARSKKIQKKTSGQQ